MRTSLPFVLVVPGALLMCALGATFDTATSIEETLLASPSESSTSTLTVEVADPSLNVTSKLPTPVVGSNTTLDTVPTAPPLVATIANVSAPGSLTVKV